MTPEERMLERFTKERQRASRGGAAFNLEEEDDLTHYGQSLSKLDDFDNVGLTLDDEDEEERAGQIDERTVKKVHFGGFDDEEEDEEEEGQVCQSNFRQLKCSSLYCSRSVKSRRPKLWLRSSQKARSTR